MPALRPAKVCRRLASQGAGATAHAKAAKHDGHAARQLAKHKEKEKRRSYTKGHKTAALGEPATPTKTTKIVAPAPPTKGESRSGLEVAAIQVACLPGHVMTAIGDRRADGEAGRLLQKAHQTVRRGPSRVTSALLPAPRPATRSPAGTRTLAAASCPRATGAVANARANDQA